MRLSPVLLALALIGFGGYVGCAAGGSTDGDLGQSGAASTNTGGNGASGASGNANAGECTSAANCDDDNPCTTDTCSQGACSHEDNNAACENDGDECTSDFCNGGICTHPANGTCRCKVDPECDDENPCTDDACVDNQCVYTPNTAPCDPDESECRDDVCIGGTCQHPNKPANSPCSDDDDSCTNDVCNGALCTHPDNGTCECEDAADCNDNNPCTSEECTDRVCIYSDTTLPCTSDNNPCTDDVCADGTCSHAFNTGPCTTDNNPCTDDVCNMGLCTHVTNAGPCTSDNNDCTDDLCVSGVCTHPALTGPCTDDGSNCTDDVCAGGVCTHPLNDEVCECVTAAQCNDNNACTTESCTNDVCVYANTASCVINTFNSSADWGNLLTTPDQRPIVTSGTANYNLEGNMNLYVATSGTVSITMDTGGMGGRTSFAIEINGGQDDAAGAVTFGVYDGTNWADLPLSTYGSIPNGSYATINVTAAHYPVPLDTITQVRLTLIATGGQKVWRITNISAI